MFGLPFEDPNENFPDQFSEGLLPIKRFYGFTDLELRAIGADAGRAVSFIPKPIITCTTGVDTTRVVVV